MKNTGTMIVKGNVENVLHKGANMVVVIDDNVEGGQRVIYTQDVQPVEKVNNKRVFGKLVVPMKKKRKRMTNLDKIFSNSPMSMS